MQQRETLETTSSPAGQGSRLAVAGFLGLALLVFRELFYLQPERSLPEELEQWFFVPSQSAGPLVVGISLWLLYRRLPQLRALPAAPGGAAAGLTLLVLGFASYLWATYTAATDLLVPALMLDGLAVAWLWKGAVAVRVVALPVGVLLFAMPLPAPLFNEVIFRLQLGTTELAGWLLYLGGGSHLVAGERILRTDGAFSVIESCSGLRSMETLSIVSILMVDLFGRRGWHAWVVVLAAAPVSFLLNGLRAVLLIVNPHSQIAAIHNLQGIAILLGGLLLLTLLDTVLERLAPEGPAEPVGPAQTAPLAPSRAATLAGVLLLALAASFWLPRWQPSAPTGIKVSRELPGFLGPSESLEIDQIFLGSTRFQDSLVRRFRDGPPPEVVLFVGMGDRSVRSQSPLSPKTAVPGSGWVAEEEGWATLGPDERRVRTRLLRAGTRRQLVYHWYEGAGSFPEEVLRALLALDRSPLRRPGEILAVRVAVAVEGDAERGRPAAIEKILSFCDHLRPLLHSFGETLAGKRFS